MAKRKVSKEKEWRPIRARAMWRVDQIFLSRSGQRVQVVMSLVNDRNGLRNEMVIAPTENPEEAVRFAARYIGGKGDVISYPGVRIRWAKQQAQSEQDELIRDRVLEDIFCEGLEESIEAIRDQLR